ncbi:glycine zipper 2TM domain-containing protein [Qipengyuania sp. ASV99]|uniref:glycine zipper 2TM domain-containing protein n=1 Tax=Qipengyuania sp. ASV99 TaxID=3399681 RepID=UPI003A4C64CD
MKTIALIAAMGSLAAVTAPASAAEIGSPALAWQENASAQNAASFGGFDFGTRSQYADDRYDDNRRYRRGDRYRGRGYDDDRYDDDRIYDRRGRYHEPRRIGHRDRVWRGRDGNYYCERDNGTTGLVIGAGLGALAGRAIDTRGDRTVGTLLGALAGGLLGREIDRNELRCR